MNSNLNIKEEKPAGIEIRSNSNPKLDRTIIHKNFESDQKVKISPIDDDITLKSFPPKIHKSPEREKLIEIEK